LHSVRAVDSILFAAYLAKQIGDGSHAARSTHRQANAPSVIKGIFNGQKKLNFADI